MLDLKERNFGKTQKAQERAVAARMVTDLECNGVCRGAVEVTNLAANLHKTDALAQECVRTFPTQHLDGRLWIHRQGPTTFFDPNGPRDAKLALFG